MALDRNRLIAGGLIVLSILVALRTARFSADAGGGLAPQAHAFGAAATSAPALAAAFQQQQLQQQLLQQQQAAVMLSANAAPPQLHYEVTAATNEVSHDVSHTG